MVARRMVFVFLCLFLIAFSMPVIAQDAVLTTDDGLKLEYIFNAGDTTRYKTVVDLNVSINSDAGVGFQIPQMNVKMVGFTNQIVKKVLENGDAEIVNKIESLKMTMMGSTSSMPVENIPTVNMTMSKRGVISNISGTEKAKEIMGGLPLFDKNGSGFQYSVFPENAVKIGEAWIQDAIAGPLGGTMHSECKLLEKDVKTGIYTVAVFSEKADGVIDFSMDPSKAVGTQAEGLSKMNLTGNYMINGVSKFSAELGKMISTNGKMEMVMKMKTPDSSTVAEQSMNISIQGSYTMFIMPPAPVK